MNKTMIERLNLISFVSLVKHLATRERFSHRWYNFVDRDSHAIPGELTSDHKTFKYLHAPLRNTTPKPVMDVVFNMLPDQTDFEMFENQCTEIFNFVRGVVNKNGFHVRPFKFYKEEKLVAIVFRVHEDKDYPCILHPEYMDAEGKSSCPVCGTEVVFGKFHPPVSNKNESRLLESYPFPTLC